MSNFRPFDRDSGYLLPPSVDEWLPQKHLARFVVEVIDGLDLRALSRSYRGTGAASTTLGCCWASGVRLRHRGVLEPQAGAGDL